CLSLLSFVKNNIDITKQTPYVYLIMSFLINDNEIDEINKFSHKKITYLHRGKSTPPQFDIKKAN
ncbi:hypothetical protein, partial [Proteus terrae]